MERQRSPRSSIVPDIALDMGNDVEGINHKPLLERDQYGESRNVFNQKISRSPRNSLVPDDYYRPPRNGARSPRNSLVPDAGLTPDMLYSSRHSLVPEASLSPRNSLIPDVTHNRSARNSLVPLTGSRVSLMSENGNPPPPRSPRHSLVPNASRSHRGSITNMELVDRSPQRSPRGSIASECLNQSPRNSIVTYDMNRSSRGSIGVNDVPRGSIGGNEEDTRSPRRNIDPETIDRTPRGSLGGLQERRVTKTSLMAQDPRRASADQAITGMCSTDNDRSELASRDFIGFDTTALSWLSQSCVYLHGAPGHEVTRPSVNSRREAMNVKLLGGMNGNRNSSPSRQKEVNNSGSTKSRGSTVQINLGYTQNTFEDSRRASSSVSLFLLTLRTEKPSNI
ncbi:hypothetical protein WN48_00481 [Eufriesea mexicana]|nr:hypothetical protein WN48_00481 [Eufriesea mexicana]